MIDYRWSMDPRGSMEGLLGVRELGVNIYYFIEFLPVYMHFLGGGVRDAKQVKKHCIIYFFCIM